MKLFTSDDVIKIATCIACIYAGFAIRSLMDLSKPYAAIEISNRLDGVRIEGITINMGNYPGRYEGIDWKDPTTEKDLILDNIVVYDIERDGKKERK